MAVGIKGQTKYLRTHCDTYRSASANFPGAACPVRVCRGRDVVSASGRQTEPCHRQLYPERTSMVTRRQPLAAVFSNSDVTM